MYFNLFLILTLLLFYSRSSYSKNVGQKIATSESVLDTDGNLLLRWTVNYSLRRIKFEIIFSEKIPVVKWIAIGFSDRGEFSNADACLLWTDYKGNEHFEDVHTNGQGKVRRDAQQNCEAFNLDVEKRSMSFERNIDICNDEDYLIEDGTTHIIWARGHDYLFDSTGLCLTCTPLEDHAFIRVRLLTPLPMPKPTAKQLQFTVKQLKVPALETTYWCKVVKMPHDITSKLHHIVQFESMITPGNEGLVHHMELFYCDTDAAADIPLYEGSCFATERPEITKKCSKVKAAWAMGALPFTYPEEAGLPIGGPKSNKYIMLEVHYNNPQKRNNWVDSSGIKIHVTSHLRKYNAAIMELGLEYTDKMAIPGGQSLFSLTGYCIPHCTGVGLPEEGIIVFGSQLHTHLCGVTVYTKHFRGGIELPYLNRDPHYSPHFQEIRILHKPVKVLPGDYLTTTCLYDTRDKVNATIGGHAITDEMCVNYMHYYPETELEVCKSSVSTRYLNSYFEFELRWDNMSIVENTSPRENYLSIHPWTPLRAQSLHKFYEESPISMQCNKSDGTRFQGDWEDMPIPKIQVPLLHTTSCHSKSTYDKYVQA